MKQYLKYFVLLSLFLFDNELKAQNNNKNNFLGLNPSLTIEPYYNKGELDINILPFVYQRTMTRRFDIRLTSIFNLGIRNNGNKISHFGLEAALPIFLKQKKDKKESSKGFYAAPILSLTRNRLENHNNIGLWLEPGYNLLFSDNFAITFGLQFGGTFFNYDNNSNKWGEHFGIKVIFGKWI